VPAYADILTRHGVDPASVTDLDAFRARVPLTDKTTTFLAYPVRELCRGGTLTGIKSIIPSSGHSGTFAFSVDTAEGAALAAKGADLAFEYVLEISTRRGLVLNCYPMGLQVPTSMAVANTGVSADVALAIVRAVAAEFEQLVIVGQPLFVKKLVEDGVEQGIDWARLRTTLVTGGEGFVESWRTYMSGLIGIADPDNPTTQFVASTMGAGELGLNLFHEIPETIRIVRRAYRDPGLREALFGAGVTHTPHFFLYYPMRSFIEEIPAPGWPGGDLAVSHTALDLPLPLLRYRTGDLVRLIPHRRLEEILGHYAPDLAVPGLKLPCAGVFGRRDALPLGRDRVTAETLKEALFFDAEVARAVTGFFHARAEGRELRVDVQLREGKKASSELDDRLARALRSALPSGASPRARTFETHAYPQRTTHERKHHYLSV
jgi:phenylacetate-CoA ligase